MSEIDLLDRRHFPNGRNLALRCQLGRIVPETRHVGSSQLRVNLFHLLGWGETWEEAAQMVAARNGSPEEKPGPVVSNFANFFPARAC